MIPALGPRRIEPEILDTLPPEQARASLQDLIRLNRRFGGHSVLRSVLAEALGGRQQQFSILDIGAASGDMGAEIRRNYPSASVTSLDHVASHMESAAPPKVCGDAFSLPFRDASFDFAFSSLFLHHFDDDAVTRLFSEMRRVSRTGVIAIDLLRSPLAYWFLPATKWLFGWDPVTVNDGPISFAAAFHASELKRLAEAACLAGVRARSYRPAWRIGLISRSR